MDIVERLRSPEVFITAGQMISPVAYEAAAKIETLTRELDEAKAENERLREVLGMWLRYSKSDYDDHAQMIIDWSEAKAATKTALKEKE